MARARSSALVAAILATIGLAQHARALSWDVVQVTDDDRGKLVRDLDGPRVLWLSGETLFPLDNPAVVYFDGQQSFVVGKRDDLDGTTLSSDGVLFGRDDALFEFDGQTTRMVADDLTNPRRSGSALFAEDSAGNLVLVEGDQRTVVDRPFSRIVFDDDFDAMHTSEQYRVYRAEPLGPNPNEDGEIFFFDGSATRQLTDGAIDVGHARVSEGSVVWQERDPVGGDMEIFFHDGTDTIRLTDNQTDDLDPEILGDTVVWRHFAGESADFDVMISDGDGPRILFDDDLWDDGVLISEEAIVWQPKVVPCEECGGLIYLDRRTGETATLVDPVNRDFEVALDGSLVFWELESGDGIWASDGRQITQLAAIGYLYGASRSHVLWSGGGGNLFLGIPVPEPAIPLLLLTGAGCGLWLGPTRRYSRSRARACSSAGTSSGRSRDRISDRMSRSTES